MRTELAAYKSLFDGQEENEVPEDSLAVLGRIGRDEASLSDYLEIADRYRDIGRSDKELATLELSLELGQDDYVYYRLALNRADEGQYAEAYRYIKRIDHMQGVAKRLYLKILGELDKMDKAAEFWKNNRNDQELHGLLKETGLDYFPRNIVRLVKESL